MLKYRKIFKRSKSHKTLHFNSHEKQNTRSTRRFVKSFNDLQFIPNIGVFVNIFTYQQKLAHLHQQLQQSITQMIKILIF